MKIWIDLSNSPHPLLFAPVARRLQSDGHEVLLTARDHAQTVELARERWHGVEIVGGASPSAKAAKGFTMLRRIEDLRRWATRNRPDIAISHNSYAQIVAARSLRIPAVTAMDFEHQPANHLAFRLAQAVLVPEVVPTNMLRRQGVSPRRLVPYPGLKEELYIGDFEPDPEILKRIGIVRRPRTVVVARTPPSRAIYHSVASPPFEQALRVICRQEDIICVTLARHPEQIAPIEELGLPNCVVLDAAIDSRSLMYAADVMIGAGGTMTREAALMGIPTWSLFGGPTPAVDLWLESRGMLARLTSAEQLSHLGPRTTDPRPPDLLRERAEEIGKVFVDAAVSAAKQRGRRIDMRQHQNGWRRRPLRRVTMLLENQPYPEDPRVSAEARSLARAGYRVRVIAPRRSGQARRESIDGVLAERFRLPMNHSGSLRMLLVEYVVAHAQLYVRGAREVLRGADVLHAHNPPDTLFLLAFLGKVTGCRFVFDQHDLSPELLESKFGPSPLLRLARRAQRMSQTYADLVITTNQTQWAEAVDAARCGPDRVIVVRNGLRSEALARPTSSRTGLLEDPSLVYVGALETQDGVEHLPAVLSALLEEHGLKDPRLTIVGDGSRRRSLTSEFKRRGLLGRVHFTGHVGHAHALAIIADADICLDVAPCDSFNHKSTMIKIIEYVTLQRPTVAFALHETVRTAGDAADYARCGDWQHFCELIVGLCRSDTRRAELSARALQRAPSLLWEHSERTLLEGYELLERSPPRRAVFAPPA